MDELETSTAVSVVDPDTVSTDLVADIPEEDASEIVIVPKNWRPGMPTQYPEKRYKICGAKRCGVNAWCTRPSGWGTDHPGEGRCKWHGGRSLSGPANPAWKTGRSAYATKGRLKAHYLEMLDDKNPLDLLPDLAAERGILAMMVEAAQTKNALTMDEFEVISGQLERIGKMAERINNMRNKSAMTAAEIAFILAGIKNVISEFVPEPSRQAAFVRRLNEFIPKQLGRSPYAQED